MTLKINWDRSNKEYWVKVGTGGRRVVAKTSKEMIKKLEDFGLHGGDWKFSTLAKSQISKEKQ
jgi:hypothetical protein